MQSIYTSHKDNIIVVTLSDQVDGAVLAQIHERIMDEIERGKDCSRMIIDFSEVSYISNAGLKVLVSVSKALARKSGTLTLCALNNNVQKIFEVSGFSKIFHITEDISLALKPDVASEAKGA